jgi:hypothetical protein
MADYAISNVPRRVVYAASGTGPYAFTFEILNQTDIAVYKASTLLTLTTDYTVTINANGTGSVTLVTSAGTSNITIVGAKNIQRTTDFTTGGDLFANTLNDELDNQTIFIQQVAETAERGLKAPVVDPTDINMTLPAKASRVGTVLAFNATTGNPEAGPSIGSVTTVAAQSANINTVATNIGSVNTVAGNITNVNTVAGVSGNVTTVASNIANVNAVGADLLEGTSEINTVAVDIANVNTVGTNIASVNTVAGEIGAGQDVTVVAANLSGTNTIGTVATNIANVNATGTNIANVNAVGSDLLEAVSEINTVATDITNVNTVGTNIGSVNTVAGISSNVSTVAGISANVTTVAGINSAVSTVASNNANVTTVATNIASVNTCATDIAQIITTANDLNEAVSEIEVCANNIANINTVGTNISNVNTVAGISADVTTVATNVADINNYADTYQGAKATDPTLRNDGSALQSGDLYFNTTDDVMKVREAGAWLAAYASLSGALIAANNLSDLTSASTARTNLGLGTGNTPTFTGVVTGAGTVSAPAITTTGDTNTGIFFPAADTIAFTEGGVESMRINSSGNVGIGTSSPAVKLDVAGNATVQNGVLTVGKDTIYDAFINTPESMYFNVDSDANSTGNRFVWGTDRAGTSGGTEWMRIDSSGNVGIGTSSPSRTFQVANSTNAIVSVLNDSIEGVLNATNSAVNIGSASNDNLTISTNGTERMRITSAGLVQILASSTNSTFTGGGDLAIKNSSSNPYMSWHNTAGDRYGYIQANSTSLNMQAESGFLSLGSITGEAMRIISGGNVGIGTTSPSVRLQVNGGAVNTSSVFQTTNAESYIQLVSSAGSSYIGTKTNSIEFLVNSAGNYAGSFDTNGYFYVNGTSQIGQISGYFNGAAVSGIGLQTSRASTGSNFMVFNNNAGSIAGFIQHNGTTTVNYSTSSDYRLKENIAPMTGALAKVAQLKPVTYTWKNTDGEQGEGFIAHELAEVCPLAVSGEKDAMNENGLIKAQGIDSSKLVAILTAAIQEQQTLIENLTTRLNALEGK